MPKATRKTGLGKGLSALVTSSEAGDTATLERPGPAPAKPRAAQKRKPDAPSGQTIQEIAIDNIRPGTFQPRRKFSGEQLEELAESIRKNGVMQPIVVREVRGFREAYEIIAGERRWRASRLARKETIPAIVRSMPDSEALELALIENIQRQDLSALEEAEGYQRLIDDFGYSQEEISRIIGKSRPHITNMLRLLGLPDEIKRMMDNDELTMGHARALIGCPEGVEIAQKVVKRGLNVRQTERLVKKGLKALEAIANEPKKSRKRKGETDPARSQEKDEDILALEQALSDSVGLEVQINDRGDSGELLIRYQNLEELDEILRRLGGAV